MKKEYVLVKKMEENLKSRKIILDKDEADLRTRKEIPTFEESFEKAFISLISYNDLRRDLSKMKPYHQSVRKAYEANDAGTFRSLWSIAINMSWNRSY